MRKLSIALMLFAWLSTSMIFTWGLTAKVNLPTLALAYISPYMIWMIIEVARRKFGV